MGPFLEGKQGISCINLYDVHTHFIHEMLSVLSQCALLHNGACLFENFKFTGKSTSALIL